MTHLIVNLINATHLHLIVVGIIMYANLLVYTFLVYLVLNHD